MSEAGKKLKEALAATANVGQAVLDEAARLLAEAASPKRPNSK